MEKFSVITILFMSIPELILGIYISFLLLLESNKLPFKDDIENRKNNLIKIFVFSATVSLLNSIIRSYVNDMSITSLAYIIIAIIAIKALYKLKWIKSIFAVLILTLLLISVESVYGPLIIELFFTDINSFLNSSNNWLRILLSLPIRFIQLTIVISLWNYKIAMDFTKLININKLFVSIAAFLIVLIETGFVYQFLDVYDNISLFNKIFGFIISFSCGLLNYIVLLLYINIIKSFYLKNNMKGVDNNENT